MHEPVDLLLELANRLYNALSLEEALPALTFPLAPLTGQMLNELVGRAEQVAQRQPRLSWAMMRVASAAAMHQADPFLQAKAAWHVAWAANEWVQPQRVAAAVDQAQTLFAALGQTGWVAACQWQRHALPWTQSDFIQSQTELEAALANLSAAPETEQYIPSCRLALAYALLLRGKHDDALAQIAASEAQFEARQDPLNRARSWFVKAACLRRMDHFSQALAFTQQALDCFKEQEAWSDFARAQCQMGFICWLAKSDFAASERFFKEAIALFQEMDIQIWVAQAQHALVQIYNKTGRPSETTVYLSDIRATYTAHYLTSLLADVSLDSASYETALGNYETALRFAQKAKSLYEQTGAVVMQAISLSSQGAILIKLGRYEQALSLLEESRRRLQTLNLPGRLAHCEIHLANTWLDLGQPQRAHPYLDSALQNSQKAHETDLYGRITVCRAKAFIKEQKIDEAIQLLEDNLPVIEAQRNYWDAASIRRWLGEAFCALTRLDEAEIQLGMAQALFEELGLPLDQAACQLVWGHYYEKRHDSAAAVRAWHEALRLCEDIAPDLEWQAYASLAALAEQQNQKQQALQQYKAALDQLTRIRGGLTQSALTDSFFSQPEVIADEAVALAVTLEEHEQALRFIETNKALILSRQLHLDIRSVANLPPQYDKRLADLTGEIRWLQEKQQGQLGRATILPRPEERELRYRLKQKSHEYDDLISELERMTHTGQLRSLPTYHFDHLQFQQLATKMLGKQWLALDYYLTETDVYGVALTATTCRSWQTPIARLARFSLETVKKSRVNEVGLAEVDYKKLADLLLPDWVRDLLQPDTTVLIAPHRDLHRLSWPALCLELGDEPLLLVQACIPVIVPSFNSLVVLWQRTQTQPFQLGKGLVVAVSEFGQRHEALPGVLSEVAALTKQMEGRAIECIDAAATWPHLQQMVEEKVLHECTWLHIASHAFYDGVTGRLSGLALHERDVWVDEFKRLVPLPPLVTLSVCSGNRGRIFNGDEQVGLTAACLVAGAQTVISSLWPIFDGATTALFVDFYQHVSEGKGLGLALALAQRAAIKQGISTNQWNSFCCVGNPL